MKTRDFQKGIRRAQFLWTFAVLTIGLILTMAFSDIGSWGGSPYLVLAAQLPASPHIILPWCLGIGAVIGQTRWRAGLAPWDTATVSTRHRTLVLSVLSAVVTVLISIGIATVSLLTVAIAGAVSDNVRVGVITSDILSALPRAVIAVLVILAATAIGAILGWRFRAQWITPVAVVVTLIAVITGLATVFQTEPLDRITTTSHKDLECVGQAPRICALPSNSAYTKAASTTAKEFYDSSPIAAALPDTIIVVDSIAGIPWREVNAPAIVDLNTSRGFRAPQRLDAKRFKDQLVMSIASRCHDSLDSNYLEIAEAD